MESELEALAQQPASPAEPPFQALVEAAGGRGQVLLVGELWEREQSRALLRDFSRAVFPPEPEPELDGCTAGATGLHPAPGTKAARAIRSPLVFVLCRSSSLAAREPRRRLREMLRDVRGRRREGAALVGVLVTDGGAEDAVAPELQLLETLLRTVFGRQVGGPVQAAAFRPGSPASSLAVQEAACRALQAAGPGRPAESAWERPGLPGLLTCFSWGPRNRNQRKNREDVTSSQGPAGEHLQVSEEELALTAIFPNGDCEDHGSGSRAQDGVAHMPPEPLEDTR
uniref:RIKEN cDNA 2810459M11 gene n=1 Tax=Cricetulus griseus TaxID=10029 RepID=A0A8C2QCN5_CRIGR